MVRIYKTGPVVQDEQKVVGHKANAASTLGGFNECALSDFVLGPWIFGPDDRSGWRCCARQKCGPGAWRLGRRLELGQGDPVTREGWSQCRGGSESAHVALR